MIHTRRSEKTLTAKPPQAAIEHCRRITKQHAKTFYLGSQFFSGTQRQAVWAVYAACRIGDDAVDEFIGTEAACALEMWRMRVQAAIAGAPIDDHPLSLAMTWAASQYPISFAPFMELHLGLKMDLHKHDYQSMEELMLYCRRVAGVVGHMIAPIAGFSGGEKTLELALHLGEAMQLTNILRDVGEDLSLGRVYIPDDLALRHGLCKNSLRRGEMSHEYVMALQELEALARSLYRQGWQGIPKLHGSAKFAVALAATAYEGILNNLRANRYDNFSRRAHVTSGGKIAMIPQAVFSLAKASIL